MVRGLLRGSGFSARIGDKREVVVMKKAKYWWSLLAGCLGALLVIRGWGASQVARAQAESDQVQVVLAKIQTQA